MADVRGTVTVLFTDQVSSTEAWQQLGEDAANALRRDHTALLDALISRHHGRTVKNTGDGLMAVFGSAVDALDASVAMQQAVHRRNNTAAEDQRIGLRVGIEIGEPSREGDDYFGTPVVVAKRLCDSCEGGQVLVSDLIPRLVGTRGGHAFDDAGMLELKGFTEPVRGHLLRWEAAADDRPPAAESPTAERVPLPGWIVAHDRTPFVGRERELSRLIELWERARSGSVQVAFIEGEPGIGKTRLAGEVALRATADDALVLFGACDEHHGQTLQPFAHALSAYRDDAALGELVRGLAPTGTSEQVADALSMLEKTAPVLLILDDMQWASAEAVGVVRQIARSNAGNRLLVIATYRGASVPQAHPLRGLIAQLRRERAADVMTLSGMTEPQVAEFIEAWSGQHASSVLASTMQGRTEGNPLFLEEVLRHLADTGALYEQERLAESVPADELTLPPTVRALVEQQLLRLSEQCRQALTNAAVVGAEFDVGSLRRMMQEDDDPSGALEEASAAGIVLPGTGEGWYRFAHSLIRDSVVAGLSTERRLELHRRALLYAQRDGTRIAYEVLGHAGPVVVITGISNCPSVRARVDFEALKWQRVATYCRVLLYDRRGLGSSDVTEHGYSVRASVEDLRAVMDAAGVGEAVLWGAVDGGPLAIAFAHLYPERVAGLLLLGTTAKPVSTDEFPHGINPHVMRQFLQLDPLDQARAASEITGSRRNRSNDAAAISEVMRRVPRDAWSKLIGCVGSMDVRDMLSEIKAPTLIVHDADNTYIPASAARYLHEHIPGSELLITDEFGGQLFSSGLHERIRAFADGVVAARMR